MMLHQAEGGVVVLLADEPADDSARNRLADAVTQGAIPALAVSLAKELGSRNTRIRANCLLAPLASATPSRIAEGVLAILGNTSLTAATIRL